MWGFFMKFIIMRKRITAKQRIVWSTSTLKPGERAMDKRYKDGVDTGRFSSNKLPLPLKPRTNDERKLPECSQ